MDSKCTMLLAHTNSVSFSCTQYIYSKEMLAAAAEDVS